MTEQTAALRDRVRQRYAAAATAVSTGTVAGCCGTVASGAVYDVQVDDGFGNPLRV